MSVEYVANYGIGFQVEINSKEYCSVDGIEIDNSLTAEEYVDIIFENPESSHFCYFSVGKGLWTGEKNEVYICINKPLKEIAQDLQQHENQLLQFIQANGLNTIGDFGLVGGLYTY